jgi:hypothetical protein
MSTDYEAPHCASLSVLPLLHPFRFKCSPQHPVIKLLSYIALLIIWKEGELFTALIQKYPG